MELSAAGRRATVLVAFAARGVSPAAMRAGKVSSVPPPATEFITPARSAATAATTSRPIGRGATSARITGVGRSGVGETSRDADGRPGPGRRLAGFLL